ncbi:MAG: hypothetical protein ACRD3T_00300 [Terriglobia bacterium]
MENYFNYFTEIEQYFQQRRGTPTLLSTLDWALIEAWKEAGIPLEAVLAGIQRSFEKFAKRPTRFQKVNGLAYCAQEVYKAAEAAKTDAIQSGAASNPKPQSDPFPLEELLGCLRNHLETLNLARENQNNQGKAALAAEIAEIATELGMTIEEGSAEGLTDLESLERRLTAFEEKLAASLTRASSTDLLVHLQIQVERELTPFRRKVPTPQFESLTRQYFKKQLFSHYAIPRLSLFYF